MAKGRAGRQMTPTPLDLDRRPILVFWESTRSCLLACRHCRASAMATPLPGQLTRDEGMAFLETLTAFGRPYPVLVLTGGDVLMRPDALDLVRHARGLGLPVAVAPSVTPRLTQKAVRALRRAGVKAASISLDGACAATHEGVRGVEGHFERTVDALRLLRANGYVVQVNTVVMRENVEELAEIAAIVAETGAAIWEVFFLVRVGRGSLLRELKPAGNEDVCHFLVDASRYGFVVRTVEAPFFRRVVAWRREGRECETGPLYGRLAGRLRELLGEPVSEPRAQTKGTRDGKGIVFVAHDGEVHPAGFLPLALGNVREQSLVRIYRDSPLLQDIRAGRFHGRCGGCEYADLCGGSRARAFAASGDPLGEDPACPYLPAAIAAA
jgi:AdoMet-dependent heme synthase